MAQISIPVILFILPLLLQAATTTAEPTQKGFTLELIHRYSDRSPFHFNRNLTGSQLLQRLIEQSVSRAQWLESTNTTTLRPPLVERDFLYMVKLSIGTSGGSRTYHLGFDTGSWLTWVRCKPCNPSPRHPDQPFDPEESPTYVQLRRNNPLCTPPFKSGSNGMCVYEVHYDDGSKASGVLSQETFTFQSKHRGRPEVIPHLTFGCTHSTSVRRHGVIGMSYGRVLIPNQLKGRIGGRFSYCLVRPPWSGASGFLRFGDDIPEMGSFQTTPIIQDPDGAPYYVLVNAISIGGKRLPLRRETFARRGSHGGSLFDTGTTLTHLIKPAYDEVSKELNEFFKAAGLRRDTDTGMTNTDVCYKNPNIPSVLPHMTLHLEGAEYHIGSENLFMSNKQGDGFCLGMRSSDRHTIIGTNQQSNVRFLYDLQINKLSFAPENCGQDVDH